MLAPDLAPLTKPAETTSDTGAVYRIEMVCSARKLHLRLISGKLSLKTKTSISRKVAGLLFAAEADTRGSQEARHLFYRLRTDAHVAVTSEMIGRDALAVSRDYERLASMV